MKTQISCATILAITTVGSLLTGSLAVAQGPTSGGTKVGVIDISKVFKNHPGFKQSMEAMKGEIQGFEGQLKQRGEQIQGLQKQMSTFKPTSAEYKKLEAQALRLQSDGQAAAQLKKKEFLEKESKIYYQAYREIQMEVSRFAKEQGFSLIVRFNSESIDPEARPSVLEGVQRAVVYQDRLDITDEIIKRLGYKSMAARQAAPAATPRRQ